MPPETRHSSWRRWRGSVAEGRFQAQGGTGLAADFTEAELTGTIFRGVKGFTDATGFDRAENFDKIVR